MARKRMIDPAIWSSEDFSRLSMFARLTWIGLISNADDAGRGKANAAYIKSQIFAYDDELTVKDVEKALNEISEVMSISFYEVDGKRYFQLLNWSKFQTINRPSPSQIPAEIKEQNTNHTQFSECSVSVQTHNIDASSPKIEIEIEEEVKDEVEDKENSLTREKESEASSPSTRTQKHKYGKYKNVLLTQEEYERLIAEEDGLEAIDFFSEYREMKGYKCKNDNLAIRKWAFNGVEDQRKRERNRNANQPPKNNKESPLEQLNRVLENSYERFSENS